MADAKISALTANTTPALTDIIPMVDDPSGTPVTQKITLENLLKVFGSLTEDTAPSASTDFLLEYDTSASGVKKVKPESLILPENYKITPTVSSNDLVLTITHMDGTTPSTTRPLYFKIGTTMRACTAALSVTKADGTNWANLGGAELGTKETDLFVYAVWNTNLTPDAVDIFWSRIPNGSLYSDFSATTTNEKYAAINATAPASTDECVLLGRFAATLSLSGTSHLWTVPTFTNINLKHSPIYETRWLSWTPVYTAVGTGTPTYGTVTTAFSKYQIDYNKMFLELRASGTTGGTTVTQILSTLPVQSKASADASGASVAVGYGSVGGVVGGTGIVTGTPDKMSMFRYDLADMGIGAARVINISGLMEI